jgi:hypothetical protein
MTKNLRKCSVDNASIKSTKAKIFSQIDSIYSTGNENWCNKFKKIASYECVNDTALGVKTRLIIKVKNKCKDWDYFYFNDAFTIVKVIHEMQTIY